MDKLVLNPLTVQLPIQHLVDRVESGVEFGGIELVDADGKTVAILMPPDDQEVRTYAESDRDLDQNESAVTEALKRRGGVTTAELLERASAATAKTLA